MELHNLKASEANNKTKKRVGRGQGSGKGGTSTRGHKGAKSRSGYSKKLGFEGGQMPLQRRVPKFGFKNHARVEYTPLGIDRINKWIEEGKVSDTLDAAMLSELLRLQSGERVKVLGSEALAKGLTIEAHKFSKTAVSSIEAAGGTTKVI